MEQWHRWITDITLNIPAGGTVLDGIKEMLKIARTHNVSVHSEIKDLWVSVGPTDKADKILALFHQAQKDREEAEEAKEKATTSYKREVLRRTKKIEIALITWPKGSVSRPHDHGESSGITIVLRGSVFEKVFDKKTKMFLRHDIHPANLNASFEESPNRIHIVGNANPDEEAITLHIYMPPLKMKFYDDLA